MEAYKNWVRTNRDYIHSLNSLANGLTWLLPERFAESEIGPEAVTAILGIITAINEHIIDTSLTRTQPGKAEPSSFPYSLCISTIKELETLVEVAAQTYYGEDKKWNFIALTEASKLFVRLALFRNSGYKMLLHGGETPNVEEDSDVQNSQHIVGAFPPPGIHLGPGHVQHINGNNPWNLEGRALSALSRFGENAKKVSDPAWLRRVQHQHTIVEPQFSPVEKQTLSTLLSKNGVRGALFVFGEVLFITRPLIYVLFIRKYGIRSWIPWCLSFAVDFIGMGLLKQATKPMNDGKEQPFNLTVPEKDELKRRKLLWALYLMRDPFFSNYTRQRFEKAEKLLEPVPIIGLITAKIVELVMGAQTRYTYMSGS